MLNERLDTAFSAAGPPDGFSVSAFEDDFPRPDVGTQDIGSGWI
jgi:hypothetical protein